MQHIIGYEQRSLIVLPVHLYINFIPEIVFIAAKHKYGL